MFGSEIERALVALESIAASLEKLANPPKMVGDPRDRWWAAERPDRELPNG